MLWVIILYFIYCTCIYLPNCVHIWVGSINIKPREINQLLKEVDKTHLKTKQKFRKNVVDYVT